MNRYIVTARTAATSKQIRVMASTAAQARMVARQQVVNARGAQALRGYSFSVSNPV